MQWDEVYKAQAQAQAQAGAHSRGGSTGGGAARRTAAGSPARQRSQSPHGLVLPLAVSNKTGAGDRDGPATATQRGTRRAGGTTEGAAGVYAAAEQLSRRMTQRMVAGGVASRGAGPGVGRRPKGGSQQRKSAGRDGPQGHRDGAGEQHGGRR